MRLLNYCVFVLMAVMPLIMHAQGVGVNTSGSPADPSAIIDVSSNSKGALLPRMSEAERNAIVNPAQGLIIFNTTSNCFNFYRNTGWYEFCGNCLPPAQAVASGNSPVCTGDTIKLNASTIPNVNYTWTGPNGFISTQQNPRIPNAQTQNGGFYSVTTGINGCNGAPVTAVITVNQTPVSTFSYSPSSPSINQDVTFTPTVTGATYAWTFQGGNPSSSTAQNPVVQWAGTGTFNVSLVVTQNGCNSATTTNTITPGSCVHGSVTFIYTGAIQTWTVPANICSPVTIECWGAEGGGAGCQSYPAATGGQGGYSTGQRNVVAGEVYAVYVGGAGRHCNNGSNSGGWNGGGPGWTNYAGSGGGASDVRTSGSTLNDRIIVAGGGGGAGFISGNGPNGYNGAVGGGTVGADGSTDCSNRKGGGGTQTAAGCCIYNTAGFGVGGGVPGGESGGGSGWYGGGSGNGSPGGGGSGYIGGVFNGSTTQGGRTGNGQVKITW